VLTVQNAGTGMDEIPRPHLLAVLHDEAASLLCPGSRQTQGTRRRPSDPAQSLLGGVADGGRAPSAARLLNCESALPLQFTTQ
jgi:hypothetical protein